VQKTKGRANSSVSPRRGGFKSEESRSKAGLTNVDTEDCVNVSLRTAVLLNIQGDLAVSEHKNGEKRKPT